MHIERIRPTVFQVTMHAYELAALVSAARWVVSGTPGELAPEALDQLKQVLDGYDNAAQRLDEKPARS